MFKLLASAFACGMFIAFGQSAANKAIETATNPVTKAKVKRVVKNIKNEFSKKD